MSPSSVTMFFRPTVEDTVGDAVGADFRRPFGINGGGVAGFGYGRGRACRQQGLGNLLQFFGQGNEIGEGPRRRRRRVRERMGHTALHWFSIGTWL